MAPRKPELEKRDGTPGDSTHHKSTSNEPDHTTMPEPATVEADFTGRTEENTKIQHSTEMDRTSAIKNMIANMKGVKIAEKPATLAKTKAGRVGKATAADKKPASKLPAALLIAMAWKKEMEQKEGEKK